MAGCVLVLPLTRFDPASVVKHEVPGGATNGVNLAFTTAQIFAPGTLEVWLDGHRLDPLDYTVGADQKSFTLLINRSNPNRLNKAPRDDEEVRVDYLVGAANSCLLSL